MSNNLSRLAGSERWRASFQFLAKGDYELGFRLYETRPVEMGGRPTGKPSLSFPEWDGRPVNSLLILPEQGYGDQIMFARYAPHLRDRGVAVTIMCHPRLVRLFASLEVPVLSAQGRVSLPNVEAWALGPSLPFLCKTNLDSIPPSPYLKAAPRAVDARIGLMLRGNPAYVNDSFRSLGEADINALSALPGTLDLSPEMTGAADFQDTAEIIAGLDVIVSVDTAVAHLAGAMGKPCLLLVARKADWRWLEGRTDSPWYSSIRLFRQERPGDWSSAIARVKAALNATNQIHQDPS